LQWPRAISTWKTLIQDDNKTVAVLVITTLLKTGSESSIDKLVPQIHPLLEPINYDFKAELCGGFGELAFKFPQHHATIIRFLATSLRDQGGHVFKSAVVDTLVKPINALPDAKELGLLHLCEFIEDCKFALLCTRILHFLGDECPSMPRPSQYIRYIHNRVVLESACVRAAAVLR
jgi:coatomer protein complex subunit gamma